MTISGQALTVIIPTWNQSELLRNCLNSLRAQTAPPRVLVVDNGSTDSTRKMLDQHFPEVERLLLDANLGFAKAVNRGLQSADTPFVALLNNDTEADPGWAEAGLRAFSAYPQAAFFASRMVNYHRRDRLDSAGDCYNRSGMPYKRGWGAPADAYPKAEAVLAASAGAAFYRRELFDDVGLMDEDFGMYLEDVEFSLRAQTRGRICVYLPGALVYHVEAASDPDRPDPGGEPQIPYTPNRVFWITRNRWQLMVLYQPLRNAPWLAAGWAKSLAFHFLKAGCRAAFLRGVWAGFRATPGAWEKRRRLRRGQSISNSQLCELLQKC